MKNLTKKMKKVLFYTHSPRAFRTTLIGHFYEISQVYPTVLLSEELDSETKAALNNKKLFPKLEDIIEVSQVTGEKRNLFSKNVYLYRLAKNIIEEHCPDVVISASDMHSIFELYLFRFSKKIKALKIAIQPTFEIGAKILGLYADLTNAYLRFPSFLPLWFRLFLVKWRKYLGHLLCYWILPLTVAEKPFFGKSSHILRKGNSGMRDADFQIVFSKRDYNLYRKGGVPAKKLWLLSHPLARETREFFEKVYLNKLKKYKKDRKVVTIMLSATVFWFRKKDYSLISKKEKEKTWIESIKLINDVLKGWRIYIKPHPDTRNFNEIKEKLESISKNVQVVNPGEPADKYIEMGEAIIGLPLSASTTLFTASFQCPKKPIISLDFHQQLLGDLYKNFEGVEYVDTNRDFIRILEEIRDGSAKRKVKISVQQNRIDNREFSNTIEMIEYLFSKNKYESSK